MEAKIITIAVVTIGMMTDVLLYEQAFANKNGILMSVLNIINLVVGTLVGLLILFVTVVVICDGLKQKSIRVLKEDLKYLGYDFSKDNWGREIPVLRQTRDEKFKPVNRFKAWCYYRADITYLFRKPVDTTNFKLASSSKHFEFDSLFNVRLQRSLGKEVDSALRRGKNGFKELDTGSGIPFASFLFVGETDAERIRFFQKNDYVLSEIIMLGTTPLEQLAPFDGVAPSMVMQVFEKSY